MGVYDFSCCDRIARQDRKLANRASDVVPGVSVTTNCFV